eukprot:TRINITY_DN10537_c0_g1_i11.p1 TRINITY_DN10537_c0_g1~~TRINITY_DN10537_c0_g1_i11.p1  ORF type:complete len:935 (-),score=175.34 TRINITY_DN10537_c0_g1_i11:75-2879(-)
MTATRASSPSDDGATGSRNSDVLGAIERLSGSIKELLTVPLQLNAVLDSLGAVHARLHELGEMKLELEENGICNADRNDDSSNPPSPATRRAGTPPFHAQAPRFHMSVKDIRSNSRLHTVGAGGGGGGGSPRKSLDVADIAGTDTANGVAMPCFRMSSVAAAAAAAVESDAQRALGQMAGAANSGASEAVLRPAHLHGSTTPVREPQRCSGRAVTVSGTVGPPHMMARRASSASRGSPAGSKHHGGSTASFERGTLSPAGGTPYMLQRRMSTHSVRSNLSLLQEISELQNQRQRRHSIQPSFGVQIRRGSNPQTEAMGVHGFFPASEPVDESTTPPVVLPRPRHSLSESTLTPQRKASDCSVFTSQDSTDSHARQALQPYLRRGLTLGNGEGLAKLAASWEPRHYQATSRCILSPTGKLRLAWDIIIIMAIICTGFAVPVQLVYNTDYISQTVLGTLLGMADVLWVLNIILNFRTAYIETGRLVRDPWLIGRRYARGWLPMDLIVAWPLALGVSGGPVVVILWTIKLSRHFRLQSLFSNLQKRCDSFLVLPLRVAVSLYLVMHTMSCIWRALQRADDIEYEENAIWFLDYISDMYWVIMTITTVGYGDIVPKGIVSRAFAIFVMLYAPVVSGTIVSALTHATKGLFDDNVEGRVSEATRFMNSRHVPIEVQRRVEHSLRDHLQEEKGIGVGLMSVLSPAVQRDLSMALLGNTILQFPLFIGAPRSFVAELAQAHTCVRCLPNDLIAEEGQIMEAIVFLLSGRVVALYPDPSEGKDLQDSVPEHTAVEASEADTPVRPQEERIITVEAGGWFGEGCLFNPSSVHAATVTAAAETELAVLPAVEYHRIVKRYPRLQERHEALEKALLEKQVSVSQLAFRAKRPSPPASKRRRTLRDIGQINMNRVQPSMVRKLWSWLVSASSAKVGIADTSQWEGV